MLISDCCGASANGNEDYGICPDCKEHCEFYDDDNEETDFQCCDDCDLPDACSDFCQCAIKEGIKKPVSF
jgi:hypothetical protein